MLKRKRHLFIIILFLLLLLIAFFWNEELDFTKKINDQKIANFFVTVFTIIGTVATIFYSIKQYKLSEIINRTGIKPDLYPKSYSFRMEDDEAPIVDHSMGVSLYLTHAMNLNDDHDLVVENVGVGIAKNINFKWIFSTSEVEQLIKGVYFLTPEDDPKNIEYIGPGKSTPISLPCGYLSCCGPRLFEQYDNKYFSNEDFLNFTGPISKKLQDEISDWKNITYPKVRPSLFLELTYTDVQDFPYRKLFKTKVAGMIDIVTFEFFMAQ